MAKAPKHKIKDLLNIEGIDKELFTKAFEMHLGFEDIENIENKEISDVKEMFCGYETDYTGGKVDDDDGEGRRGMPFDQFVYPVEDTYAQRAAPEYGQRQKDIYKQIVYDMCHIGESQIGAVHASNGGKKSRKPKRKPKKKPKRKTKANKRRKRTRTRRR